MVDVVVSGASWEVEVVMAGMAGMAGMAARTPTVELGVREARAALGEICG